MIHPATRDLFLSAARQPDFQALLQRLTRGETGPFSLSGLVNTAKALYLVLLYQATERPLFVLVDGNKQAETLLESIEVFFQLLLEGREIPPPQLIPAQDVLPHQRLSPHNEIAEERAVGLWRLSAQRIPITIVPVASALLRIESERLRNSLLSALSHDLRTPLAALMGLAESLTLTKPSLAGAQTKLIIPEGNVAPLPIAVPDFVAGSPSDGEVGIGVAQVITNNLRRSGLFAPIDQAAFIERIVNIDAAPQFQSWKTINAQALVTGRMTRQGDGRLKAEFRLWDVASGQQLIGQQYFTSPEYWRRASGSLAE